MTISFNGVNMLLADPDGMVDRFVRSYSSWPQAEINSPPPMPTSDTPITRPNWPKRPPMGVNQLYFPTGASRWACGLFLTDQAGVDSLAAVLDGKLIMDLSNETVTVSVTPTGSGAVPVEWNAGSRFCSYMHKLDPVPVSVTDDTLWVVPLVDVRYFWQGVTHRLENIETWEELITELAGVLTEQSNTDDIESDFIKRELSSYDGWMTALADPDISIPDVCFFSQQPVSVANAMDLVCWSLGLRFIPEDMTTGLTTDSTRFRLINYHNRGSYPGGGSTIDPGVYQSQRDELMASSSTRAVAGGDSQTEDSADVPNEVQMRFVVLPSGPDTTEYVSTQSLDLEYAGNFAKRVWCPAVPTADNHDDLDTLAELWATDFAAWVRYKFRWTWPGGPTLRFSGYEDYILFSQIKKRGAGYLAHIKMESLNRNWGWEYVPLQSPGVIRSCSASGGGGTSQIIRFKVVTLDEETRRAICEIESCDCDVDPTTLPGQEITPLQVEICDPLGCYFNEPSSTIVGRQGWAKWMRPIIESVCQPNKNYTTGKFNCQWEVFSICCPIPACEDF